MVPPSLGTLSGSSEGQSKEVKALMAAVPAQWMSGKKDVFHKSFLAYHRASSRHLFADTFDLRLKGLEMSGLPGRRGGGLGGLLPV